MKPHMTEDRYREIREAARKKIAEQAAAKKGRKSSEKISETKRDGEVRPRS